MTAAGGSSPSGGTPCLSYVVPLCWTPDEDLTEITGYLRRLGATCEILVVDGSCDLAFARHRLAWSSFARHLRPDPELRYLNGKVNGVITGVRRARSDRVVIADDDVRYDPATLLALAALLGDAELVIPQNYFDPLPWHAAWDSARSLINRSAWMDYPGTLALRRSAFLAADCYDGDVLFENLELIREFRAAGARIVSAPAVLVRRLPPRAGQFAGQRVRQAYDSLAQPVRLAAELALLPAAVYAAATRPRLLGLAALAGVAMAEAGRRRHDGCRVFPARCSALAPAWLAERSVCSWLAVGWRLRGGIGYAGQRLRRSAASPAALRRRAVTRGQRTRRVRGPESGAHMRAVAERLAR